MNIVFRFGIILECIENGKELKITWMLITLMSSHFDITSGAMSIAYRAPLDFCWITLQIMINQSFMFPLIIFN